MDIKNNKRVKVVVVYEKNYVYWEVQHFCKNMNDGKGCWSIYRSGNSKNAEKAMTDANKIVEQLRMVS